MATLRELKGRIGSVASSEKITGAMKMISSAKMHKAEQGLRRLVPFRNLISTIIGDLLQSDAEFSSPLTDPRPDVKRQAVVVLGSDDGLCGAYNVNIYKVLIGRLGEMRQRHPGVPVDIIPVGAKMAKAVSKIKLDGVIVKKAPVNSKSEGDDVRDFLETLRQDYTQGRVDRVHVLYMNFQSVSRQRPRFDQLLPVSPEQLQGEAAGSGATHRAFRPCLFEPSAEDIFRAVVPMYLLSTLQEIFIQNRASEQAARVMAMQAANDNAKKLLEQLRLEYNKLRQQSITTELLDIVGGQVHN